MDPPSQTLPNVSATLVGGSGGSLVSASGFTARLTATTFEQLTPLLVVTTDECEMCDLRVSAANGTLLYALGRESKVYYNQQSIGSRYMTRNGVEFNDSARRSDYGFD